MRKLIALLCILFWPCAALAVHDVTVLNFCGRHLNPPTGDRCVNVYGHNSSFLKEIDTTVWNGPTVTYNWIDPDSPVTLYGSSSDTTDTEIILIRGYNAAGEFQQTTVTLDGFTFVPLAGTWTHVIDGFNLNGTAFDGDVYISSDNTDVGGDGIPDDLTTVHGFLEADEQTIEQAVWRTPIDHECAIVSFSQSLSTGPGGLQTVDLKIKTRPYGGVFRNVFDPSLSNQGFAPGGC